ncbi:hypothetical protein JCM3770_006510 [Rhodotorula araucariae]
MSGSAPPLPRRPQSTVLEDPVPDEPPPPYSASPTANHEQTLEYGPTRPFQPPPRPPQSTGPSFAPPSHPPPPPQSASPGPSLPPPSFPFWNGAGLTPAQTGFSDGPVYHGASVAPHNIPQSWSSGSPLSSPPHGAFAPPPHPPPRPGAQSPPGPPLSTSPRPAGGTGGSGGTYNPTETPTPGQPLLNQGRLLVYPPGKEVCWKCSNTGYKPFDPYTGYAGDDPGHPCRKCWQKHGRPFTPALRVSLQNPTAPIPANYQRPLRLLYTPQTRPIAPQVIATTTASPYMPIQPGALVVRPGDPRIGGVLCRRCGGDGLVPGLFLIDEMTCEVCNGAGRVFT